MELRFAENLKTLRRSRGLSQKDLAKMVGVDQRTVSAWENGVCEPSFTILLQLCSVFNESLDGILT